VPTPSSCPEATRRGFGVLAHVEDLRRVAYVGDLIPGQFGGLELPCHSEETARADGLGGSVPVRSVIEMDTAAQAHCLPFHVPEW